MTNLRTRDVLETVARFYGIPMRMMWSNRRWKELIRPRTAFVLIAREDMELSLKRTGRALHRHHTTIKKAQERGERWMRDDPDFSAEMAFIRKLLRVTHGGGIVTVELH
jgi:chromosomal replication initiation ATPase DnaA